MGSEPMKFRVLASVAVASMILFAGTAQAVEPYIEFVQALRDQRYYDYAILYLDQIAAKANTPDAVKVVIPYQKAMVLQESAKSIRSPEKQLEQIGQAEAFLEQFVKDNPKHPMAADANSDRATMLLNRGQAEVQQSKSPTNQGGKREFQNKARETLAKARAVFQAAFDQHDANYKTYPAFIDQQKDPDQYAARAKVEQNLITASLSLAMCTYEEAESYDAGSTEFKTLLTKAAEEFEKMHQKYRSQVGGLYARAWQGKCYEEQKDLQKAMGIYNELLEHPGDNAALNLLKTQTLYFKMICLNSKERHDHQLAVDLAEDWLKKHQAESTTRVGLGIQWEQALAYEALGDNREILKPEQERFWKQARTVAMAIQNFPGEYKDVATAMVQRIQVKLGGKEKAPADFDTAFGLGNQAFATAQDIKKEIDNGKGKTPADELAKLNADRNNELQEASRNFELALSLAKPTDDKKSISKARLYFAYTNYWLRRNYEAAVLAQFVARTVDKDEDTVGLDAAYIAMAAYVQAYNDNKAPIDQKAEDMRLIVKASNLIAERWPSSDKANEAYMMLGKMVSAQKRPAEAAVHFGKVPETDPKYPEAQLLAGNAYWAAYVGSVRLTGPEKPTPEQMAGWLQSAQSHLKNGITKLESTLPKGGTAPAELIAAKMSLAQIMISQGKDAEAEKLLVEDPHSVIRATTIADEAQRPEVGVQARRFALEAFKLLLRVYISQGKLEKARETMTELEKIAAAGGVEGGEEVVQLFVGLGKQLRDELERIRANGEADRFNQQMTAFETFLSDMANRKEGQSFGTLSWLGETYFALGQSMLAADPAKASAFFDKASTSFKDVLARTAADQNFASAMQLYSVKLRLISVLQLQKDFASAETLMNEVLKENSNNLKIQVAAAEMYQEWGFSGQADSIKKLVVAIQGTTKVGGNAWGWGQIAVRLQKSTEFPANPTFVEGFLNARYNGTLSRKKYASEQPPKEKQKFLEGCRTELTGTALVTKDMSDEWYAKFNTLYREVLAELNQPVTDLPRAVDVPVSSVPDKPDTENPNTTAETGGQNNDKNPVTETPKLPEEKKIKPTTWLTFIGFIVAGLVAVGWIMLRSKPKPKSFGGTTATSPATFAGIDVGEALPPATFAAPKPKARPAAAASGGGGAATAAKPATKPAAKPAAPGATGTAPKPKPKPPSPPPK
jgi:hypothetical protein